VHFVANGIIYVSGDTIDGVKHEIVKLKLHAFSLCHFTDMRKSASRSKHFAGGRRGTGVIYLVNTGLVGIKVGLNAGQ
jgi:hypothetical protein